MVLASFFGTAFFVVVAVLIVLAVARNVVRHGWRGFFRSTGGSGGPGV